jgi:hypothetical protein
VGCDVRWVEGDVSGVEGTWVDLGFVSYLVFVFGFCIVFCILFLF